MYDKLKDLGIRITELSTYLRISRPTLYKYIESYENKDYKNIDHYTYTVLKFINKKEIITKLQVIDYIINSEKTNKSDLFSLCQNLLKEFEENKQIEQVHSILVHTKSFTPKEVLKCLDSNFKKGERND